MTDEALKKAVDNRKEREGLLDKYNLVSRAISEFGDERTEYRAVLRLPGTTCYEDVHPSKKEFRLMLLNVRDRLDAEITRLDKEFIEL